MFFVEGSLLLSNKGYSWTPTFSAAGRTIKRINRVFVSIICTFLFILVINSILPMDLTWLLRRAFI